MAEITTRTVRLFEVPRTLLSDFRAMQESKQVRQNKSVAGQTIEPVHFTGPGNTSSGPDIT